MEGMGRLMQTLKERIEYFIKDIYYIIPVLIVAILCFGFVLTHTCVSIDTLSDYRYFEGEELLAQKRFGTVFLNKIFHVMQFNPFFVDFIAVMFLVISAITFCMVMQKASNGKIKKICYTIFSCLFISYPLINEIFVYTPAGLSIALGYFGTALSVLFMQNFFENKKWGYAIFSVIIMIFVTATYESFVSVFFCSIMIVLILQNIYKTEKISLKKSFVEFLKWLIPIILAIIISRIVASLIMNILNIQPSYNAAQQILYGTEPLDTIFHNLIDGITYSFILKGLYYLPITVLVISVVLNFIMSVACAIRRKSITIYLLFLGARITLIALSILQGSASPYRTCQVFALFTAFTFMFFTSSVMNASTNKVIKTIIVIAMFTLVFYQSKDLHKWFYLNNLRYESEKQELIEVANQLNENYDTTKPVYFVATFSLPVSVKDKLYMNTEDWRYQIVSNVKENMKTESYRKASDRITETCIFPYFYWGYQAFRESGTEIFKWLKLLGYQFKQGDANFLHEHEDEWKQTIPKYPNKGYIYETNNYIVVNL